VLMDHLHSIAFQETSLAFPVWGTPESVKTIRRKELLKYRNTFYKSNRIVVAAAGGVTHKQLVDLVTKGFDKMVPGQGNPHSPFYEFPGFAGSQVTIRDDTQHVANVAIGLHGVSLTNPDYVKLMLLQKLTGSYDRDIGAGRNATEYFTEMVAYDKLAYKVDSFNLSYHHNGIFGIVASSDPDQIFDLIRTLFKSYNELAHNLTQVQLDRAKKQAKSEVALRVDGLSGAVEDLATSVAMFNQRKSVEDWWARIDSVSVKDLRSAIFEYCHDADPALAASGALYDFPDYNFTRAWTHWKRL